MREGRSGRGQFYIIPVEVTTAEGHLLCLGVVLPFLKGPPAGEVAGWSTISGGVAIPPIVRPFSRGTAVRAIRSRLTPSKSSTRHHSQAYNPNGVSIRTMRRLPMNAGSDAHHESAIAPAYNILHAKSFRWRHSRTAQARHGMNHGISRHATPSQDLEQLAAPPQKRVHRD